MDVQLYVYDLSRGLAREMSMQFLGIQVDAVFHTSLVFGGVEYFFGAGVQTCYPGRTQHGEPMEKIPMGHTALPMDVISEYLESLKDVYTAESYDIFAHNCNNFTNDFSTFLVGHGIPDHIVSLPQTVLDSPFGAILKPQIDRALKGMAQAPAPPGALVSNGPSRRAKGASSSADAEKGIIDPSSPPGKVLDVTSLQRLTRLLTMAQESSAVIFFTNDMDLMCSSLYALYEDLALKAQGKCYCIRVNAKLAEDIGAMYSVRTLPTFLTFLKGRQETSWTGPNPNRLQENVVKIVDAAFPRHPHQTLALPVFRKQTMAPILYNKARPLDKLQAKISPIVTDTGIMNALAFIKKREGPHGAQDAPIPDMVQVTNSIQWSLSVLSPDVQFIVFDILRLLLVDARVSGWYLSTTEHLDALCAVFEHITKKPGDESAYNLRLCAVHAACNLFSAPLSLITDAAALANDRLVDAATTLITTCVLDRDFGTLRNSAAALAFNVATADMEGRVASPGYGPAPGGRGLPVGAQVEIAASLVEMLGSEEDSSEAVVVAALALARLVYLCPLGGDGAGDQSAPQGAELLDLCAATGVADILDAQEGLVDNKPDLALLRELRSELFTKGLEAGPGARNGGDVVMR